MSHFKLREENNCLNCGNIVQGRYCTECGQENRENKISAWALFYHFISDLVHFDGKFFKTMKWLFIKPGRIPKEFVEGKRQRYVDPIRMYIFTSAVFFFLFFMYVNPEKSFLNEDAQPLTKTQTDSVLNSVKEKIANGPGAEVIDRQLEAIKDTSSEVASAKLQELNDGISFFENDGRNYTSYKAYESFQDSLPKDQRDGWFKRKLYQKQFEINEKYKDNSNELIYSLIDTFLHKLPILFFISIPIFALLLMLLYIRSKRFYYVDHAIFSMYHFVFSFLVTMLFFLISELKDYRYLGFLKYVQYFLFFYWLYYFYKSLKVFYEQRGGKTIFKMLLMFFGGLIFNIFLFVIFFFFSVFQL